MRLSPRPGVMGRKEGSQRAVWPSGRPLRPAPTRPNPPNPGQSAPFASQIALPERRGGRPSPLALPPPLRKNRPGPVPRPPDNNPGTRRRPPQSPRLQPPNPNPQHRRGPPLHQGDRNPPESVIAIGGPGDRNRPEQVIEISGMRRRLPSSAYPSMRDPWPGRSSTSNPGIRWPGIRATAVPSSAVSSQWKPTISSTKDRLFDQSGCVVVVPKR